MRSSFTRSAMAAGTIVALSLPLAGFAKTTNSSFGLSIRDAVALRVQQMNGAMFTTATNVDGSLRFNFGFASPHDCIADYREWRQNMQDERREWFKENRHDDGFWEDYREWRDEKRDEHRQALIDLRACLFEGGAGSSSSSHASNPSSTSSSVASNSSTSLSSAPVSSVSSTASQTSLSSTASSTSSSLHSNSSVSSSSSSTQNACVARCPDGHEYRKCVVPGFPIYYFVDPCRGHYGSSSSRSSLQSSQSSMSSSKSSSLSSSSTTSASLGSSLSSSTPSSVASSISSSITSSMSSILSSMSSVSSQ